MLSGIERFVPTLAWMEMSEKMESNIYGYAVIVYEYVESNDAIGFERNDRPFTP